jgi:hypothetical protein
MEFSKKPKGRSLDPLAKILGNRKPEKEPVSDNGTAKAENRANGTHTSPPEMPPVQAAPTSAADPLEAIRNAVFGDTIEGLGGKFDSLESEVHRNEEEMKKHVADGFSAYEKFMRRELKTTVDRINEDAAERQRQFEKAQETMEKQVREAEERVVKLEKELREANTKTNDELVRRADSLNKQIEDTGRRVYERAHTEISDLESSVASRSALREMFRDLGEKLSSENPKIGA